MNRPTIVVLATLAAGAAAPPLAAQSACPDNFLAQAELAPGQSLTCRCESEQTRVGNVWGSDRYTADSSLCRAALHAGVIGERGGEVTAYASGPCSTFAGSSRHGVLSGEWGPYDRTFAFRADAGCTSGSAAHGGLLACPGNAAGLESRARACALECWCAPEAIGGSVWGSDLYTLDSSICAAARHAGAVPPAGGTVAVFVGAGCQSFKGTTRNAIASSDWEAFGATFAFRYPLPNCADGKAPAR